MRKLEDGFAMAKNLRMRHISLFAVAAAFAMFPSCARAWGRNAHRLIVNKAVDTLRIF